MSSSSQLYQNDDTPLDNSSAPNIFPLISINATTQITIKLTSRNYNSWRFQFHSILMGYDLMGFIDGSHPCPSPTIQTNDGETPNPDYNFWIRQDQLILSAIASSITPALVPFIASSKTSREAWTTLANTYAKPTRGHLNQLKDQLRLLNKGTQTITEYLQHAKTIADELVMFNTPFDHDDFILKILGGLDDDYSQVCSALRVREAPITFDELHEILLNHEAYLKSEERKKSSLPANANPAFKPNHLPRPHQQNYHRPLSQQNQSLPPYYRSSYNQYMWRPRSPTSPIHNPNHQPRPYLGKCQLCRQQGHSATRCLIYKYIPRNLAPHNTFIQPQAPHATTPHRTPTQLLDSSTSHHVTTDIQNMTCHDIYNNNDDILIRDGTNPAIIHNGSSHRSNTYARKV